jgi:hypothetical protein
VPNDQVRQTKGEDLAASPGNAKPGSGPTCPKAITPLCAECGTPSARIELVAPGHLAAEWSAGPAPCKLASCSNVSWDSRTSYSRASPLTTATAIPSTLSRPGGSLGFRPPSASPRSTQPVSTTMQDSAGTIGRCSASNPRHGKSLDPHRSPLAIDHYTHQTHDLLGLDR